MMRNEAFRLKHNLKLVFLLQVTNFELNIQHIISSHEYASDSFFYFSQLEIFHSNNRLLEPQVKPLFFSRGRSCDYSPSVLRGLSSW